jgi:hypothetical protein
MYDGMGATHHANRQAVAGLLRDHAESIHAAWHDLIAEQSPFAADVPASLLDAYLDALANFVADPDPAVPAVVGATWCQLADPTTAGAALTAVAMGLLGEALRLGLPESAVAPTSESFALIISALPDFSAEFVRGMMRNSDMPIDDQHWYQVSQRLAAERTHRLKQLAILNDVSMALSSTLSLDEVYEIIYEQASRLVDTSNFYIATLGPNPGEMKRRLHYFGGVRVALAPDKTIQMGLTREVVNEQRLVTYEDYDAGVRERGFPLTP